MVKKIFVFFLFVSMLFFPVVGHAISITPDAITGSNATISCGTTATLALASNGKRRSFVVVAPPGNTATAYVGFSTSVTTAVGIPLNANNTLSDNTYVGAVYCIAASGTVTLIVAETSR